MSVTTTAVSTTNTLAVTTIDAKAFAGLLTDVALFASRDNYLPSLYAVQLQRGTVNGKTAIVARSTDRYALAEGWVHCDSDDTPWPEATILVPFDGVKQILAVLKTAPKGAMAIVTVTGYGVRGTTQITVDNMYTSTTVHCADAEFPNTEWLWSTGDVDNVPPIRSFGPTMLARPAAVAKRRNEPLRIHWAGKSNGAVLMTVGEAFRVVVMTYRDDEVTFSAPVYG